MKKNLEITLKSDLCVASGYSYAGVVDSEVCYDKYGLPYIPARRLKGCFSDTCKSILYDYFDNKELLTKLFGESGANASGSLRISNARLRNYRKIIDEITSIKRDESIGHLFSQHAVLDQYTRIIAQTALGEDSTAEDSSLRYTRVVNHYIPAKNTNGFDETVFEAVIEYDENLISEEILEIIVGATKHIGLKRNRGLGVVSCKIGELVEYNDVLTGYSDELVEYNKNDEYVLTYTLSNDEPLMLSLLSDIHSEKYISGQTMLGCLAATYLKAPGKSADTSEFKDLFLNGVTKYVNAYPALINEDGKVNVYYPAPLNINRLKKTKAYVNTLFDISEDESKPGNQPKKIKGKFLCQNYSDKGLNIEIKDVDMKIYYHHRKGDDSILYPSEAIEPDQLFAGEVHTLGKYVNLVKEMLDKKDFYFGKSKSAQYGHCYCEVKNVKKVEIAQNIHTEMLVTLLTDAIFCEEGEYTVATENIKKQVCECLGLSRENCEQVLMETGLVSGYQTTWNMHKPLYPFVKAGSCFVLKCDEGVNLPDRIWIGTKNQEGFGYASVVALQNSSISEVTSKQRCLNVNSDITELHFQYCNVLKKELLEQLITKSFSLDEITKTQVSRVILMLKQSRDFDDFKKRVASIKNGAVKSIINNKLINPIEDKAGNADVGKLIKENKDAEKLYVKLVKKNADLSDLWREYLLHNLIICKYEAKEG